MRIAFAAFALLTAASCTSPDGQSAPNGAMFSPDEALKTVFEDVCVPAILEGKSVETLARGRSMIQVDARGQNAGADDREWRLAALGDASVMAWADGTCMASVEMGDSSRHTAFLLSVMAAKGVKLVKGQSIPATNGGINTAWCTADPQPLVLGIITPTANSTRKIAVVANLFRAKAARPTFCNAS